LLVGKAGSRFYSLCIETPDDEYCLAVDHDDLVAVSMPEGGPIEQARMMLELVRRYHIPLVVSEKTIPVREGSRWSSRSPRRFFSPATSGGVLTPNCISSARRGELTGLSLAGSRWRSRKTAARRGDGEISGCGEFLSGQTTIYICSFSSNIHKP
jgi:hypothetical protein